MQFLRRGKTCIYAVENHHLEDPQACKQWRASCIMTGIIWSNSSRHNIYHIHCLIFFIFTSRKWWLSSLWELDRHSHYILQNIVCFRGYWITFKQFLFKSKQCLNLYLGNDLVKIFVGFSYEGTFWAWISFESVMPLIKCKWMFICFVLSW